MTKIEKNYVTLIQTTYGNNFFLRCPDKSYKLSQKGFSLSFSVFVLYQISQKCGTTPLPHWMHKASNFLVVLSCIKMQGLTNNDSDHHIR